MPLKNNAKPVLSWVSVCPSCYYFSAVINVKAGTVNYILALIFNPALTLNEQRGNKVFYWVPNTINCLHYRIPF